MYELLAIIMDTQQKVTSLGERLAAINETEDLAVVVETGDDIADIITSIKENISDTGR